jgi:hypothetical protein
VRAVRVEASDLGGDGQVWVGVGEWGLDVGGRVWAGMGGGGPVFLRDVLAWSRCVFSRVFLRARAFSLQAP